MSIKALTKLIPPPSIPLEVEGKWTVPEAEFGIQFPTDFRELLELYGTGEFKLGGLLISNPLSAAGRKEIQQALWTLQQLRDGMELSWFIHPERPGYLPWGRDHHGNIFCWWTAGEPEKWPIVQLGHGDEDSPHKVKVKITTFLINYALNKYPKMQGGTAFDETKHRFVVGRPWERQRS